MRRRSNEERFWAKVDKNGPIHPVLGTPCWLWTASVRSEDEPYGQFGVVDESGRWRTVPAHRFALESKVGPIGDLLACHHCDNPPCCNPEHLFAGTQKTNADDCTSKGRDTKRKGENHWSRRQPERLKRGDDHPLRKHPELAARGARHGWNTHPEARLSGDRNPARLHPERFKRGEEVALAKLDTAKVLDIRRRAGLESVKDLAIAFKVNVTTIERVIKRVTWRHVP